ncbi:hypothetical protein Cni_G17223 [Canna indica]|uniref:NAB domain-containing protein n=1 Tax=Canna indica TaxID=4628 RepID=A0AAQ3KGK0_9LILI|nr:hypothetical protein Cni_G17223 [Canna indica]
MLHRAASNAYSWWWASHIRTKQSKWLDINLQEMEDLVKRMMKLIEADADSFAKRAELYFKRRPELISFVEDVYRAYRALAERYDHISGELHKANHTIATACPDQVQYAMLEEEEDSLPKAITPIDPSKINKPVVEGLMKKKRESESSIKKKEEKTHATQINKEEAQEEINKLQKEILVLQTEKEYIKSSYESGIAKYWEIEKQVMETQEKVCCLQDEFSTSAVIEDNEARTIMTSTALKSCEDAIVSVKEQRSKSLEQAKVESERIKTANVKLKSLKGEHFQSEMENPDIFAENKQMSFTAEKVKEDADSLNKARLELQSICEKIKTHFEMNPESSAIEIAEKINELVNKVIALELTVSSQAVQINRLTSENNELDKSLQKIEVEKTVLINDSNMLSQRLKEAEDELSRVQTIEKTVQDDEMVFQENFTETCRSLNGISEKLQSYNPPGHDFIADALTESEASTYNAEPQRVNEDKDVTEIHHGDEDFKEVVCATQELGHCLETPSQNEAGSELKSAFENSKGPEKTTEVRDKGSSQENSSLHLTNNEEAPLGGKEDALSFRQMVLSGLEGKEMILLAEYKLILQNYEETRRRLSVSEKKNEEQLLEMMALIEKLKNVIAMKDEEIRLLRQQLASLKTSSNVIMEDTRHGHQKLESTLNSQMITQNSKPEDFVISKDINISTSKRESHVKFTEIPGSLEEDAHVDRINAPQSISHTEEKFRKEIDTLLDGNLEFWLRFSTSFHHIQEFKSKYDDLQAEIKKLGDNKTAESSDSASGGHAGKPEVAPVAKRLRELKTELQVWLEQGELLMVELQSRISSLGELQEEISSAIKSKSESAEVLLTPYQAAKFHGEVINMKQENSKAASELQVGLYQVRRLQTEIEDQLSRLCEKFEPFPLESGSPHGSPHAHLEHSSSKTRVPLRVFLFGAKPKKPSFFQRIQPVFQKQNTKLKAVRGSKRFSEE